MIAVEGSHERVAASAETVVSLGRLLSTTPLPQIAMNVLGCLTNLSQKGAPRFVSHEHYSPLTEPGRSAILSQPEAVNALITTLRPRTEEITKEKALICLGNLSVNGMRPPILPSPRT